MEKTRSAFGYQGICVMSTSFDKIDASEFDVLLTDNWKLENAIKIKLRVMKPAVTGKNRVPATPRRVLP